jgi:hypothetical protein
MSDSYHPDDLRKCEFTGRLSRNLVRSRFDGRYYDETVLSVRRRQDPALQEIRNELAGSLVAPISSQFRPGFHLSSISESEKQDISQWVAQEAERMSQWLVAHPIKGYFDFSDKSEAVRVSTNFSERIVREPDNLILLRLLFFRSLYELKGRPVYSRSLEVCFKLLAAQVSQNKFRMSPSSFAASAKDLSLLHDNGVIPELGKLSGDLTMNMLSYLSFKDVSSYLSTSKGSYLLSEGDTFFKDKIGVVASSISFCYELSLQDFYLQGDPYIREVKFTLESGEVITLDSLMSYVTKDKLSLFAAQRQSILDYRHDRVMASKSEVQAKLCQELAPEIRKQKLEVQKERELLDEQRRRFEKDKHRFELERCRILQEIFKAPVITEQDTTRYGLSLLCASNNAPGSEGAIAKQVFCHRDFATFLGAKSKPEELEDPEMLGESGAAAGRKRSFTPIEQATYSDSDGGVKRSKSLPSFSFFSGAADGLSRKSLMTIPNEV